MTPTISLVFDRPGYPAAAIEETDRPIRVNEDQALAGGSHDDVGKTG